MSEKTEKMQVIIFEPITASVKEMATAIHERGEAEICHSGAGAEIIQIAMQFQPCVLVISITDNDHLPNCINVLKRLEKQIKSGALKTLVTSKLKNRQLSSLIASTGVVDYLEEPVPVRTILFKTNLLIRAATNLRNQKAKEKLVQERIVIKKEAAARKDDDVDFSGLGGKTEQSTLSGLRFFQGEAAANSSSAPAKEMDLSAAEPVPTKRTAALKIGEDMYLFRNTKPLKLGSKYIIDLEGPPPEAGKWKKHPSNEDGRVRWRWSPENEEGMSEAKADGWIHSGELPEFLPQSGKWRFTSEHPDLYLMKNGMKYSSKYRLNEAGEFVCADDTIETEEMLSDMWEKTFAKKPKPEEEETNLSLNFNSQQSSEEEVGNSKTDSLTDLTEFGESEPPKEEAKLLSLSPKTFSQKAKAKESPVEDGKPKLSALEIMKKKRLARKGGAETSKTESLDSNALNLSDLTKTVAAASAPDTPDDSFSAKGKDARLDIGETKQANEKSETNLDGIVPNKDKTGKGQSFIQKMRAARQKSGNTQTKLELPEKPAQEKSSSFGAGEAQDSLNTSVKEKNEDNPIQRKLREQRDTIKNKVRELLDKPLPANLNAGEESELRKRYGINPEAKIGHQDLARRRRLDAIQKLKDKLRSLEKELGLEESKDEIDLLDLKKEVDRSFVQAVEGEQAKKSRLQAFDTEGAQINKELAEATAAAKKKTADKETAERVKYFYLPWKTIQPLIGAWEPAKPHYVYVGANVRYKGFLEVKDLLPIWYYSGEAIPELLEKSRQWRFASLLPKKAESINDVPETVVAYLLELREQINREKNNRLLQTSDANNSNLPEFAPIESVDSKSMPSTGLAEDSLKLSPKESSVEEEGLTLAKTNKDSGSDLVQKPESNSLELTEKALEVSTETGLALENSKNKDPEAATQADGLIDKFQTNGTALEEKLGSLKENLAQEEAKALDSASYPNLSETAAIAQSTANESAEAPAAVGEIAPATTTEPEKKYSDSIESFFEKRKQKERKAAPEPPKMEQRSPTAFLGIFLALSDAVNSERGIKKGCKNAINAIQDSFGDCVVAILYPKEKSGLLEVRFTTGKELPEASEVPKASQNCYPIANTKPGSTEPLGYLLLKPLVPREMFYPEEEETVLKCLKMFSVILGQEQKEKSEPEAA